jgi:spore cortex formation protein SpoVR/YcgB (stage V sporulation)
MDAQEILAQLKDKVSQHELQSLNEIKAGKQDHENLMDCIHTVNDQLKHTIILLNENIKLSVKEHSEHKNALEKRQVELLQQVKALQSYTIRKDADDAMSQGPAETSQIFSAKQSLLKAAEQNKQFLRKSFHLQSVQRISGSFN